MYQVAHTTAMNQKVKCPLHDDRTASMTINVDKGAWFCHACSVGGSGVDLIMHKEGVGFREARDIYEGVADGSSGTVRSRSTGQSSRLLPESSRHQRRSSRTTPTWLRDK
jgi:DNA primase